jgi:plasmid maintenance system antidote protein VapI
MIPENRIPAHPGVILSQEFLAPLGITQVAFAAHLGVPVQRINLQTTYDLARSRSSRAFA